MTTNMALAFAIISLFFLLVEDTSAICESTQAISVGAIDIAWTFPIFKGGCTRSYVQSRASPQNVRVYMDYDGLDASGTHLFNIAFPPAHSWQSKNVHSFDALMTTLDKIPSNKEFVWYDCAHGPGCRANARVRFIDCTPCGQGYRRTRACNVHQDRACSICGAGYYQPYGESTACYRCGGRTYTNAAGRSGCSTCPVGYITNSARTGCQRCPPRYYQSGNSCLDCGVGRISNAQNTGCIACPAGQIQSGNQCVSCAAGKYQSGNQCLVCPPRHVSSARSTSCQQCDIGFIPNNAKSACVECADGTYQSEDRCLACPAGSLSNADKSGCVQCSPGTFQVSSTLCAKCDATAKSYSDLPGSTSCKDCSFGSVANVDRTECLGCLFAYQDSNTGPTCIDDLLDECPEDQTLVQAAPLCPCYSKPEIIQNISEASSSAIYVFPLEVNETESYIQCLPVSTDDELSWFLHITQTVFCAEENEEGTPKTVQIIDWAAKCWSDVFDFDNVTSPTWDTSTRQPVIDSLASAVDVSGGVSVTTAGYSYMFQVLNTYGVGLAPYTSLPLADADTFMAVNMPDSKFRSICSQSPCPCGQVRSSGNECVDEPSELVRLETYAAYGRCVLLPDVEYSKLTILSREVFLTHELFCLRTDMYSYPDKDVLMTILDEFLQITAVVMSAGSREESSAGGLLGILKSATKFMNVVNIGGMKPTLTVPSYGIEFYSSKLDRMNTVLDNVFASLERKSYFTDLQEHIDAAQDALSQQASDNANALADLISTASKETLSAFSDNAQASVDIAIAEEEMYLETFQRVAQVGLDAGGKMLDEKEKMLQAFDNLANATFTMIEIMREVDILKATISAVRQEQLKRILNFVAAIVAVALTIAGALVLNPMLGAAAGAAILGASAGVSAGIDAAIPDANTEGEGRRLLRNLISDRDTLKRAERSMQDPIPDAVNGVCLALTAGATVGGVVTEHWLSRKARKCQNEAREKILRKKLIPNFDKKKPNEDYNSVLSDNDIDRDITAAFATTGRECSSTKTGIAVAAGVGAIDATCLGVGIADVLIDDNGTRLLVESSEENRNLGFKPSSACGDLKNAGREIAKKNADKLPPQEQSKPKPKSKLGTTKVSGASKVAKNVGSSAAKLASRVAGPAAAVFAVYETVNAFTDVIGATGVSYSSITASEADQERINEEANEANKKSIMQFERVDAVLQRVIRMCQSLAAKLFFVLNDFPMTESIAEEADYDATRSSPVLWDSLYHELLDVLILDTNLCPAPPTNNELARRRLVSAANESPKSLLHEMMEHRRAPLSGSPNAITTRRALEGKAGDRIRELESEIKEKEKEHEEETKKRDQACQTFKSSLRQVTIWAKGMHQSIIDLIETKQRMDFASRKQEIWKSRIETIDGSIAHVLKTRASLGITLPEPKDPIVQAAIEAHQATTLNQQILDLIDTSTASLQDYCNVMSYLNPGSVDDLEDCAFANLPSEPMGLIQSLQQRLNRIKEDRFKSMIDLVYSTSGASNDRALEVTDMIDLDRLKSVDFQEDFTFSLAGPLGGDQSIRGDDESSDAAIQSGPFFCDMENVEMESFGLVFLDGQMNVLSGSAYDAVELEIDIGGGGFIKTLNGNEYKYEMRPFEKVPFSYTLPATNGACASSDRPWFYGQICHGNVQFARDNRVLRPSPYTQWKVRVVKGHHHLKYATRVVLFADIVGNYNRDVGCHPHASSLELPHLEGSAAAITAEFKSLDISAAVESIPTPDANGFVSFSFGISGPIELLENYQDGEFGNDENVETDGKANVDIVRDRSNLHYCHVDFIEMTNFGLVFLDAEDNVIFNDEEENGEVVMRIDLKGPFVRTFQNELLIYDADPYEGISFSYTKQTQESCQTFYGDACVGISFNPSLLKRHLPSPYAQWNIKVTQGGSFIQQAAKVLVVSSYHGFGNPEMGCGQLKAFQLTSAGGIDLAAGDASLGGEGAKIGLLTGVSAIVLLGVVVAVRKYRASRQSNHANDEDDESIGFQKARTSDNPIFDADLEENDKI